MFAVTIGLLRTYDSPDTQPFTQSSYSIQFSSRLLPAQHSVQRTVLHARNREIRYRENSDQHGVPD